ncbi:MAG TPA: hypothetical protein VGP82_00770, partial [Ktedonobacterales bacterium]|nr:hypothetical protein [Ktedonobacterales bacterium]
MASQTCLRCGALCDEDATVCYTCGAPLGEVKSPTQPVPIPKLPQHLQDQDQDVDPAPQSTPPLATSTSAIATLKKPKPETTGAERKRRWPVFVLLAMLVLALLGGGGYVLRAI